MASSSIQRVRSIAASGSPAVFAAALGGLNTLSFAPVAHGGWFELLVFAALYWQLTKTRTWYGAALTAAAFGLGNYTSGLSWMYVSMHDYGGMAPLMAGAAVALLSVYLAIFPAVAGLLWYYVSASRPVGSTRLSWLPALTFAASWTLGEWLRGWVLTGLPWLSSGYPQIDGPLGAVAPLVGVYGAGFLMAWVAALLSITLRIVLSAARVPGRGGWLPGLLAVATIAACLGVSGHEWTVPFGRPLAVRLLQGNVPQDMKFEQAGFDASVALYQRLITERPADLIVTPETAIPTLIQQIPAGFGSAVRAFADRTGTAILLGAIGARMTEQGPADFTNSQFGITPGSQQLYRYDKHHLVPFGEFVPYGFHWFVAMLAIPLGDQSVGPPVQPSFAVGQHAVAVNICYEDIFGEEVARTLRSQARPASILVNTSNLGWFGHTVALDQHLQMARMRALETGRPLLAAANTGITASIGRHGEVLAQLPIFTIGSLDVQVQGTTGLTPYVRLGNSPVVWFACFCLALGLGHARRFAIRPGSR